MATNISGKHLQIDKAKSIMVISIAVAAGLLVFALISSKSLWSQAAYQKRVITEKKKAVTQLKSNVESIGKLEESYKAFINQPANIIGGSSSGTGDRDGDNGKIILDALPSKYDFPGLVSSLEKILSNNGFSIETISGTDDEVNQASAEKTGMPVEIPFEVSVKGPAASVPQTLAVLELSIRPMNVTKMVISGEDSEVTMTTNAKTYYLPEKAIKIDMKEVK